jgi:hypothetical protein
MDFILNADCAETPAWRPFEPEKGFGPLHGAIINKVAPEVQWPRLTTANLLRVPSLEGVEDIQTGYMWVLSRAYSQHQKIAIAPHDVWYIVLAELAEIITKNVEACRPIFTKSPDKIVIDIPTDDFTAINLNLVEEKLRTLIPVDLDIFMPTFSTLTPDARYACLAAFCESASHYYEYMTFACGLPAIQINGTLEDWVLLQSHASKLAITFAATPLTGRIGMWMSRVCVAIDNIVAALDTQSPERLQDIFTSTRIGSGAQLKIDGWFADIYSKGLRGCQLDAFPASLSAVPYQNRDTGRKFKGVHGCLMTRRDEAGFVHGSYGEIVTETVPVAAK